MREFEPDKVFGTGGYVSFAPLLSGLILKIPTYIHESNIIPGKVTRGLSRLGCRLLLNSEKTLDWLPRGGSGEVVGNPLLSDLGIPRSHARRSLGLCDGDILIVSFGGSGGSKVMNDVILEVMQNYTRRNKRIKHIHATGKKYYDEAKTKYHVLTDGVDGCKALPYIEDMPIKLAAADIVIARCGAMTISEIAASGAASILIPSPNVTDNHQYENALHLTKQSAAIMIEEKDLNPDTLTKEISILVNSKDKRNTLGTNIAKTAIRDSANRISRILMG
jgi:UDP-N-acetylglucosamine--N-acetylmuramyl-(pentapeptide) pyrophosphoryl-undecaprenol N-acetylglucosamine transferase